MEVALPGQGHQTQDPVPPPSGAAELGLAALPPEIQELD